MSGYLLDTNVISEIARPSRDANVVAFLDSLVEGYISVITIHELCFGLERLQHGGRRAALTEAVEHYVAAYGDRLLDVGEPEARAAAGLRASAVKEDAFSILPPR